MNRSGVDVGRERPFSKETAPRRRLVLLTAAGLAMLALLGAIILLYVNFPAGHNVLYGLSPDSTTLFRTLWPYPILSIDAHSFTIEALLSLTALWGVYLVALAWVGGSRLPAERRQMVRVIAAFALIYNVVLTWAMPPVLSSDLYRYALWGRMPVFYGLNPHIVPSIAIEGDPLWPFGGPLGTTTPYGPVWTLISAAAALLGGQSALQTAIAFKGVAALFNLANCLLVFLLARRLTGGDGVKPLLLYGWNPLILIETAGSGHSDVAMMTFVLLGLLQAVGGRPLLGLAGLLLSMLLKWVTAPLLLLFGVYSLVKEGSWRRATGLALRMAAVTAVMGATLYLPAWAGAEQLGNMAGAATGSMFHSPGRLLLRSGAAALLATLGDSGSRDRMAETMVVWGTLLGFVLMLLLMVRSVAGTRADWPRVIELWGVASLLYTLFVYSWTYPWYFIPALTMACVGRERGLNRRLAIWSTGLAIAFMMLYAVPIATPL